MLLNRFVLILLLQKWGIGYLVQLKGMGLPIIIHKLLEIMSETGAKSVEFRCLEQNHASINIALKSGAKLINSIPNFMVVNGFMQNLNIYRVQL